MEMCVNLALLRPNGIERQILEEKDPEGIYNFLNTIYVIKAVDLDNIVSWI